MDGDRSVMTLGFIIIIYMVVFLLYVIPSVITMWQLFKKAGKPGWASIVPVYSSMVMAEIAKLPVWLGIGVGVLGLVNTFIPYVGIVVLVGSLYILNSFIKQYDKGLGFWAAFIFLPIVAVFLVKDAKYNGGPNATQATPFNNNIAAGPSAAPVGPIAPQLPPTNNNPNPPVITPGPPTNPVG